MKYLRIFPLLTASLLTPRSAFAQTGVSGGFTYERLIHIAYRLVEVFLQIGEFFAVGFVVWYGLRMVMSRGDAAKFAAARKGLLLAALGVVIIFGAYVIIQSVQGAVESVSH